MPLPAPHHKRGDTRIAAAATAVVGRGKPRASLVPEQLEDRLHWSVSQDANGWTVVTASADTKIIYVSSSTGSDSNTGLSSSAPVYSFKKAESLLVSGKPDWILLKSGDTFTDTFANWIYSGRSASEPVLVSYYGTGARPIVNSGSAYYGFSTYSYVGMGSVNYLDVIGIQFIDQTRNPSSPTFNVNSTGGTVGFAFYAPGGNVLVEDCTFQYYVDNFDIEAPYGPMTNITIRRTLSADAWCIPGHAEGIYANGVDHLSIVQSTFDHNGWETLIPAAVQNGYDHDMYFSSTCTNIDVENNIISNASFAGVMARSGGTINNNVFINDCIAVSFGNANGQYSTIGGVTGSLIGNMIIGDASLPGTPYGQGFEIGNTMAGVGGVLVANNIFTQDSQHNKPAILLTMATGTYNPTQTVGDNDITLQNNIINGWGTGIDTDGRLVAGGSGLYALTDLKVLNNDIINSTTREVQHDNAFSTAQETWSGNRYYDSVFSSSSWVQLQNVSTPIATWISKYDLGATVLSTLPYSNTGVSVATYDAAVGGPGTVADFIAQARSQSITTYQPIYMAQALASFVKAGFTITSSPPTATAAAVNLNTTALGSTTYSFTVNYTDQYLLNTATMGSTNLLVTGPNGYSSMATFVSAAAPTTTANGYQQTVATYQITPPGGTWVTGEDGKYTITLLPNQVADKAGYIAADAVIGTFAVDFTSPAAIATAAAVTSTSLGLSTYSFSVTYSDASGISIATLGNNQLQVNGPNGYSQYATIAGISITPTSSTVTYTVAAPNGSWDATANGTYQIALAAGAVADAMGNTSAGGVLTSFAVQIGSASVAIPSNNASISGQIFNDANGNGVMDSREVAMVGATVYIDLQGTGVYAAGDPTAVTDANGNYTITGLSAGQYIIREVLPSGYVVTTPTTGITIVALTTNQVVTGVNFADQLDPTATSSSSGKTAGIPTLVTTGTNTITKQVKVVTVSR